MRLSLFVLAALCVVCCSAEIRALDPKPQSTDPNHWWCKRFKEKSALIKAGGSQVVFIGDSITQGWNSTYDSLSYANRVSDFFNADSVIQGVGGAFFHPSIFDDAIDYDPDFVIFAFGTNDWGIQKSHDELRANAAAFIEAITKKFAGKKIFGLSPIWRGNSGELKPAGYFVDVCKTVKEEIVKHGVTLIDGETLTPHMTDFFSDLYLHPNGLGFGVYAENLCKQLKEYIW